LPTEELGPVIIPPPPTRRPCERAEPEHFGRCDFTGAEVLNTEIAVSEVSGKPYRTDQQLRSAVSGKAGHKEEFLYLCVPRTSSGVLKVRPGNIGDEGRQEQVVM
jgi:hypothetical protein